MTVEFWYRYEDKRFAAPHDEFDNPIGGPVIEVHVFKFQVVKTTPKGVWLNVAEECRFVLRGATKRFACPTLDEAKASFVARKRKQIRIYQNRINLAEQAIRHLEWKYPIEERPYFPNRRYMEFA